MKNEIVTVVLWIWAISEVLGVSLWLVIILGIEKKPVVLTKKIAWGYFIQTLVFVPSLILRLLGVA